MPRREPLVLLTIGALAFIGFGIAPIADRFTWLMENLPTLLGLPFLIATYWCFPLTPLLYRLLLAHALVLMIGGHWTYARVPAGDWVREWLHLSRNPYDRFGHLMQGFVPVILFRELLLRQGVLMRRGAWTVTVLIFMVLGLSAAYELLEWLTAELKGAAADDFLGTQGDPWDTQWDMCCALIGGAVSLALLPRVHDQQLERLRQATPSA